MRVGLRGGFSCFVLGGGGLLGRKGRSRQEERRKWERKSERCGGIGLLCLRLGEKSVRGVTRTTGGKAKEG